MDPEENARQQIETANDITAIWDKADPATGDLTPEQYYEIAILANSLAGLVQGMAAWNAKQVNKNTVFTVGSGDGSEKDITVRNDGEWGIGIGVEGYGVCEVNAPEGFPVYVEWYNDHPRVFVWGDINSPDPTHTIDLDGALESRRKPWPE